MDRNYNLVIIKTKSFNIISLILLFYFGLNSCSGPLSYDNHIRITGSLSYKVILGKYVFVPDSFKADKLGISIRDTII